MALEAFSFVCFWGGVGLSINWKELDTLRVYIFILT